MGNMNQELEVKNFYKLVPLAVFRKTEGVIFDKVPIELIGDIKAIERVIHKESAVSPGPLEGYTRPWYMHPHQKDHLLVFHGGRTIELYSREYREKVKIIATPDKIIINDEKEITGTYIVCWPTLIFHRIVSFPEGSVSVNFAVHLEGFDLKNNFSIYDLDEKTGHFTMIREGYKDQF